MVFPKKIPELRAMLADDDVPLAHRTQFLVHVCMEDAEVGQQVLESLVRDAKSPQTISALKEKKTRELSALLKEMREGPLRYGTFISMLTEPGLTTRARVILEDSSTAFVLVPDAKLAGTLRLGDTVVLEGQGRAVLFQDTALPEVGEEGRFERRIDDARVAVTVREHEARVMYLSSSLMDQVDAGQVQPGSKLLVCPKRQLAYGVIPDGEGFSHYRFLCTDPVPDVVLERDVGSPPAYVGELLEFAELHMTAPDLAREYNLRSCATKLLSGVSGSGKTFSLLAFWNALYELMSEVTGVPVDELPPRVLRMRTSEILSKWLGVAEQNLDRFFDEAEEIAAKPFVAPDGASHLLPVLVVLEEVDGFARTRGSEPILDRILTTVLRRLDGSNPDLADKLIFFVATTNVAGQVDPAFLRRVGGTVESFGRLGRGDFTAIAEKHLERVPLRGPDGTKGDQALAEVLSGVTGWLFGEKDGEPGQVELHFTGAAAAERRYRRDFLTASIVDRAVQDAAARTCGGVHRGQGEPGVTLGTLLDAFDRQIRAVVDQLHPQNAGQYLDLPDGVTVGTVRRVPQPSVQSHHLERVA